MIRRLKRDVLAQLPPKRRQVVRLPHPAPSRQAARQLSCLCSYSYRCHLRACLADANMMRDLLAGRMQGYPMPKSLFLKKLLCIRFAHRSGPLQTRCRRWAQVDGVAAGPAVAKAGGVKRPAGQPGARSGPSNSKVAKVASLPAAELAAHAQGGSQAGDARGDGDGDSAGAGHDGADGEDVLFGEDGKDSAAAEGDPGALGSDDDESDTEKAETAAGPSGAAGAEGEATGGKGTRGGGGGQKAKQRK